MSESFVFYISWLNNIKSSYPDDINTQDKLIRRIIDYGLYGEKDLSIERMFMQGVYDQIDKAQDKHNRRVEAGRKGGQSGKGISRNQGNSNAKKKNNSKTIANVNVNENDNINVNSHLHTVNDSADGSRLNAEPPSQRKIVRKVNEETGEVIYVYAD